MLKPLQDCLMDSAIEGLEGHPGASMASKPCCKARLILLMLVMEDHVSDLIVVEARQRNICSTLQDFGL
jgi:hypothetical protein